VLYVTEEMLQDGPQAEAFINESLPTEFRTVLDNAIMRGTGAGQPLGILNSACLVSITKESSGNGTGTLLFENVSKMLDRQIQTSGAVWVRNSDTGHHLRAMKVGDTPIDLANMSATGTPQESLFGLPSFIAEPCSTVGTVGDILNANFGYYLLGQKGGIQTAASIHVQFLTAQTAFRFILRVDGQPWTHSAITPMNGTNTLSPFVATETRS
jgi:HK97 family phage major capsid protein